VNRVKIISTPKEKIDILQKMRYQKLDRIILYGYPDCTESQWLSLLNDSFCLSVMHEGEPAGLAIFSNHENSLTTYVHFFVFREYFTYSKEYGNLILSWMENSMNMKCFLAKLPARYIHAISNINAWGFTQLARLPGGIYRASTDSYEDALLFIRYAKGE
jgi:hypothetical protein